MQDINRLLVFSVLLTVVFNAVSADFSKYSFEAFYCKLLRAKYIESQPWIVYPIVFEPVVRGRLTIWSGVSTLPGSEYECSTSPTNGTNKLTLNIENFVDKFEWTFFDMSRGLTFHGVTVYSRENSEYEVTIDDKQSESYMDCNSIENIRLISPPEDHHGQLKTMCRDCKQPVISLVDNLIGEMIKSQFDDEIINNLYWHLAQMIGSQRFSEPISL